MYDVSTPESPVRIGQLNIGPLTAPSGMAIINAFG